MDDQILELTKVVNDHFFPGIGKPNQENILSGYLNIISDVNYNAMGTVFARKLSEKVSVTRSGDLLDFGQLFKAFGNN